MHVFFVNKRYVLKLLQQRQLNWKKKFLKWERGGYINRIQQGGIVEMQRMVKKPEPINDREVKEDPSKELRLPYPCQNASISL